MPRAVVADGPKAGYRLKIYSADYPQEKIRWHCDNQDVEFELLALPPGTMQMLPTNQFYNVED